MHTEPRKFVKGFSHFSSCYSHCPSVLSLRLMYLFLFFSLQAQISSNIIDWSSSLLLELSVALGAGEEYVDPDPHGLRGGRHQKVAPVDCLHAEGHALVCCSEKKRKWCWYLFIAMISRKIWCFLFLCFVKF